MLLKTSFSSVRGSRPGKTVQMTEAEVFSFFHSHTFILISSYSLSYFHTHSHSSILILILSYSFSFLHSHSSILIRILPYSFAYFHTHSHTSILILPNTTNILILPSTPNGYTMYLFLLLTVCKLR